MVTRSVKKYELGGFSLLRTSGEFEWATSDLPAIVGVINGEVSLVTGQKKYVMQGGDVAWIAEGAESRVTGLDGVEAVIIALPHQAVPMSVKSELGMRVPVMRFGRACERTSATADEIEEEMRNPELFSEELIRAALTKLAIEIARCENEYPTEGETSSAVAMAVAHISEHIAERISLPDVAKVCKVSTAYLSRKFKKEVGIGFADYVSAYRLDRAAAMLKEQPELSVTEIAFSCGFNDSNYFSDKFKKRFGIPPIKFKRQG